MSGRGHFEGEHLLLRKSHECLLPRSKSTRHMGDGYREDGKPQVDDTVIQLRKLQVCARRKFMSSKRI